MHSLGSQFESLRSAIEPSQMRKQQAKKADDPVREHLETDESFAEYHENTFLYGSYKRRTAICDIKDVDLIVVTNFTTEDDPNDVLATLRDSLLEIYDNADLADQRRSIRVDRPFDDDTNSELTLDVVPAIYQSGDSGLLWVPDREKQQWVKSHPQGHIDCTSALNADSYQGKTFVRLTKMMKWWWQYQWERLQPSGENHKRKPKGFWIEVMCGQYADLDKESYPEQILALLENAFADFSDYRETGEMPELADPGMPGKTIKTSMDDDDFSVFLDVMETSLEDARAAVEAETELGAARSWRKLFGDKFPLTDGGSAKANLLRPPVVPGRGLTFPPRPIVPDKPEGFARAVRGL